MVLHLKPYQVTACGITDIGLVRLNNEDVWAQILDYRFFMLADGMGGHQAGEIASKEAVNVLCRLIKKKVGPSMEKSSIEEVSNTLKKAIEHVNLIVYKMGRSQVELRGMGTTLCCLLFHPKGLIFGHVGDSRIYCLRDNQFVQLTKDHSLLRELLDQGHIDNRQASDFMYKNIITKAIGTEPRVQPTITIKEIKQNDIYLMCSDGLSDLLSENEIQEIVEQAPNIQVAAETLVSTANIKGGFDNITVVIVKVEGLNDQEDLSR